MTAALDRPLDVLVGMWTGTGHGAFPTIEPFDYAEEVTFAAVPGKPFLTYGQRTRHAVEDRLLHAESGYWRWAHGGRSVEVVLAHPTGIAEILEGTVTQLGPAGADGLDLLLRSRSIGLTGTAKDVRSTQRRFSLRGDVLRYTVSMASVGLPLQDHLHAELHRA